MRTLRYTFNRVNNVVHAVLGLSLEWLLLIGLGCYVLSSALPLTALVVLWGAGRAEVAVERFRTPSVKVSPPQPAEKKGELEGTGEVQCIACVDPSTGVSLGKVKAYSPDEVLEAVKRARTAQTAWCRTTFTQRRRVLWTLQRFVLENMDDITKVTMMECGKGAVDAAFGEILTTLERVRWTAEYGEEVLAPEYRQVGLIAAHKLARVEYHPLGVVGAIVSWNYPFHNALGPIVSGLFAGNAVVVKVSELTSWSASYFLTIVREILRKVVGEDVVEAVQIIPGYADAGEALVGSVDKLTFIGSDAVGRLVMKKASETLTPVVLELGGKDCAVVCDDADLDRVLTLVMRGTFQACGQNCVGLERLIVHERIYREVVDRLTKRIAALTQGSPQDRTYDTGAMTMGSRQTARFKELLRDATDKGATVVVGGKAVNDGGSSFFTPTLLVDVTPEMRIAQEEVFGPICVVMKAEGDEHAIRLANSCAYGLGSSVFSTDYKRAEALGSRIRAGMLNINDFGVNYLCQALPFGGVASSGFDRFAGVEGLRGNCITKSVTTDACRFVRTKVPKRLDYPIAPSSYTFCKSLLRTIYSSGLPLGAIATLASS